MNNLSFFCPFILPDVSWIITSLISLNFGFFICEKETIIMVFHRRNNLLYFIFGLLLNLPGYPAVSRLGTL